MKDSIRRNLERLLDRYVEVGRLLSDPEVLARPDRFRDLSVEYARLEPVARRFDAFLARAREREALAGMVDDDDPDLRKGFCWVSEMLARGVYMHPWHNMFLCAAMTPADIDQALDAADGAFAALKREAPSLAPVEKLAFLSGGQR